MDEEMPFEQGAGQGPKVSKNVVILIVALVVILAGAAVAVPWLLSQFGGIEIPDWTREEPMVMLVIGQPSIDLLADLDNQRDLVYYRVRDAADLDITPRDELGQYDVVLLDQHMGTTPYDKSVSRTLGEAMENYVKTGGKLIVVMDSGIYRSGGIYGTGVASDVIGWKATFGDIMPVECELGPGDMPTCKQPIAITGKISRLKFDHRIMEGIEVAPADPAYGPLSLITFDVKPTGDQIAYIKHIATAVNYPGILEKKLLVGKVLYFNYDPAITPGIWSNTLEYLR